MPTLTARKVLNALNEEQEPTLWGFTLTVFNGPHSQSGGWKRINTGHRSYLLQLAHYAAKSGDYERLAISVKPPQDKAVLPGVKVKARGEIIWTRGEALPPLV